MPNTASPVGVPSGALGAPWASVSDSSAHRQAAPRQTSARCDSSSVVTVRSASPRMSRQPMRSRWRYLNRRSAFMRVSRRVNGSRLDARSASSSSASHWRIVRASRSHGKSVGCRRSVSARNWLVPESRASSRGAAGYAASRRRNAARSPWAARRSMLLSAMSGSGEAATSARSRGKVGSKSSTSRGVGASACKFTSAVAGSSKPQSPEHPQRPRIIMRRAQ